MNTYISDKVIFAGTKIIGLNSIIGDETQETIIGDNAKIGRFSIIEGNVVIGDNFELDDYCVVYANATIGNNVKLLYSKKIYGKSIIGNDCIIGGNIPERCILGNRVTFMGEVAHSHYDPTKDWDTTDEPSPIIGEGSIIGVNAILVGGRRIGKNCYVSTGEILRTDLPDNSVFIKNEIKDINSVKGLFKTRY